MKRPLFLGLIALAVSAVFAVQAPSAMDRLCHSDRQCPRGDYCRISALPGHPDRRGVCARRTNPPQTAPAPSAGGAAPGSQTMCPMIYQPVCGADGKTYPNQCHATRAGVKISHTGSC